MHWLSVSRNAWLAREAIMALCKKVDASTAGGRIASFRRKARMAQWPPDVPGLTQVQYMWTAAAVTTADPPEFGSGAAAQRHPRIPLQGLPRHTCSVSSLRRDATSLGHVFDTSESVLKKAWHSIL